MAVLGNFWLYFWVLSSILYFVSGQDADCDFYQNVASGTTYYVYSPNYPNLYPRPKTCRWQATCPANTNCRLTCSEVNLPSTTSCTGDRLLISKTGDSALTGADKYCGLGTVTSTSTSNKISVGLVTLSGSAGGKFYCTLDAVSASAPATCSCGWKKTTRIAGGVETGINEYPMMAGVVDVILKIISCGGTIISTRHVVTAAHCLYQKGINELSVLYGDHNIKTGTETSASTLVKVQQLILHPSYVSSKYDYDIGLIVTATAIVFSDRVGPACLPFNYASSNFASTTVDVLGWGTTSFAGADSDYLRKVQLQVISQTSCINAMGSVVTSRIMCTYTAGKDACQHDSGGPVLWYNPSNSRLYLVGVIIGGYGCATTKPGLNTRVTEFLSWISSNAVGATLCRA